MLLQAMPACLCAAEPLLDTPSSLPAVQLQLRMVESTIANAEHDLEASWLNTCFPQPAPGFYVDEEWGFAGAPQLRRCSEALGDFRDARQKLLRRLEELQSPKQAEEAMANAAEDRLKERVRRLEFKLADAESWNDKMSEAMQKLLQTQAGLEQSVESLETQCAALRHQTSAAESCKDQIEGWLESQRMAQESTIEQLRAENVKLQRENATLAEQAQLQRQRADRLHQENDQLRGQGGYPEMLPDGLAADCDACSDASWVCVLSSDRNIFAAGTMLKAKVGQAFEYLQAKDLQKGAQILASDDQSLLEVLDTPEAQRSVELIELWTEDRMLSVARQQLLLFVPASGDPLQEEAASLAQACLAETLHPGDWIKVNGRFSRLTHVEVRALGEAEHVQFDLSPSLPAATFSLALREKDPFVAAV